MAYTQKNNPFTTNSPIKQNKGTKKCEELRVEKNIPKVTGGAVGGPMGSSGGLKLFATAAAGATAIATPALVSGGVEKMVSGWNTFVDKKVKPAFQNIKDKVSGKPKKVKTYAKKGARGA
jgi:hypothetical protein